MYSTFPACLTNKIHNANQVMFFFYIKLTAIYVYYDEYRKNNGVKKISIEQKDRNREAEYKRTEIGTEEE